MRIALCLHGLFNSATDPTSFGIDGYHYIKKHILSKGDVDVYVHNWEPQYKDLINGLYNPIQATYEPQKDFTQLINERGLNHLQNTPRPPSSVLSHFYSIQKSFELLYNSGHEYDIVIKSRFDLGRINRNTAYFDEHAGQFINFQTEIESDKLYQAYWSAFDQGPSDVWFYGSQSTMKPFTTIYDELYKNMLAGSEYHQFAQSINGNVGDVSNSVIFYKFWMMQNGLWQRTISLNTQWE